MAWRLLSESSHTNLEYLGPEKTRDNTPFYGTSEEKAGDDEEATHEETNPTPTRA
jgi:hypothetical protein